MATSAITDTLLDPNGTPLAGIQYRARLMPPGNAYRIAEGTAILPAETFQTNASGVVGMVLERVANITPAGKFYEITVELPPSQGGQRTSVITVGVTDATLQASLLVAPPADAATVDYATQLELDTHNVAAAAHSGTFVDLTATAQTKAGKLTLSAADSLVLGVQGSVVPRLQFATPDAAANWTINSRATTFDGIRDDTLTFAYNHQTDQTKQRAGVAQWALQMEAVFKTGPLVTDPTQSEFILAYTSPDGTVTRRPWFIVTKHDTANAHKSEHVLAGVVSLCTDALFPKVICNPDANTFTLGPDVTLYVNDFIIQRTAASQLSFGPSSLFSISYAGTNIDLNSTARPLALYGEPSILLRRQTEIGTSGEVGAGNVPLTVTGTAGQSVELLRIRDSGPTTLFSFTAAGLPKWVAAASVQTTVGAAGAASAPPATPSKWLKVVGDNGTTYVIPAYLAA